MKRIFPLILALLVLLACFTACGAEKDAEEPVPIDYETMRSSEALIAYFRNCVLEKPDATPEELGARYAKCPLLKLEDLDIYSEPYPEEYTPYIAGIDEQFDIPRYASITHVTPKIWPNTFTTGIFDLEEGTDAEAFADAIYENLDPAWNCCMIASEKAVAVVGNRVIFVMCDDLKYALDK